MSNEQTKNENLPVNFDDSGSNNRVIQGTLLRCTDGHWADRDGSVFPSDHPLIALATTMALQYWRNQTPVETIMKNPGEPLPDVKELNDRIPQTEWEEGLNGEPRPPWVLQHIVYMLDPRDASTFTFINSTIGARIAVERLADKVKWMRALRGEQVVPVVKLDTKPMTTRFGQKMRPEFTILEWRQLGVNLQHEAAPQLTHAGEQVGQSVKSVTTKQALNDEIPF